MSLLTKFKLNLISSLFANVQTLLDQSEARTQQKIQQCNQKLIKPGVHHKQCVHQVWDQSLMVCPEMCGNCSINEARKWPEFSVVWPKLIRSGEMYGNVQKPQKSCGQIKRRAHSYSPPLTLLQTNKHQRTTTANKNPNVLTHNSLAPGRYSRYSKFHIHIKDRYLENFLRNCLRVNAKRCHWW